MFNLTFPVTFSSAGSDKNSDGIRMKWSTAIPLLLLIWLLASVTIGAVLVLLHKAGLIEVRLPHSQSSEILHDSDVLDKKLEEKNAFSSDDLKKKDALIEVLTQALRTNPSVSGAIPAPPTSTPTSSSKEAANQPVSKGITNEVGPSPREVIYVNGLERVLRVTVKAIVTGDTVSEDVPPGHQITWHGIGRVDSKFAIAESDGTWTSLSYMRYDNTSNGTDHYTKRRFVIEESTDGLEAVESN